MVVPHLWVAGEASAVSEWLRVGGQVAVAMLVISAVLGSIVGMVWLIDLTNHIATLRRKWQVVVVTAWLVVLWALSTTASYLWGVR